LYTIDYPPKINQLGGKIVDIPSIEVTHLISNKISKTEKFLCAVASGAWILHSSFIEDSFKSLFWKNETEYEWSVENFKKFSKEKVRSNENNELLSAIKKGREKKGKIFSKWVAFVLAPSQDFEKNFQNILKCGGATIIQQIEFDENIDKITHFLAHTNSENETQKIKEQKFYKDFILKSKCKILKTNYIISFLCGKDDEKQQELK
jgi:transcriptional regulator of heat shock response